MARTQTEQSAIDKINEAGGLEATPSPVPMQTNEQIKPWVEPSVDTGGWELEDGTTITAEQFAADQAKKEEEMKNSSLGAATWLQDTLQKQSDWMADDQAAALANLGSWKAEDIANTEALADEQKRQLDEQQAENKRREAEMEAEAKASRDLELKKLEFEQDQARRQAELDRENLQIEKDALKQANEQAIRNAEAETERKKWQSLIAYHKLWLSVSWAIVQASDRIFNEWIQKITEIKAKMNLDERRFGIEDKKINQAYSDAVQKYTFSMNDVINQYSEKINKNKSDYITKYNEIAWNLRLTALEKKKAIDAINQWYRKDKREQERQFLEDTIKVKEAMVTNAERIEKIKKEKENDAKTKIQAAIASWAWHLKTPLEKQTLLAQAGLTEVDWKAIEEKTTWDEIVRKVTEIMPEEFTLDFNTKNKIRNATNDYLKSGYSLDVAVDKATSDILKDTPEYKQWQRIKELSLKEKEAKLNKALKPTWVSNEKADLVVWTDGKYYWADRINRTLTPAKEFGTEESVYWSQKVDPNEEVDPIETLARLYWVWANEWIATWPWAVNKWLMK